MAFSSADPILTFCYVFSSEITATNAYCAKDYSNEYTNGIYDEHLLFCEFFIQSSSYNKEGNQRSPLHPMNAIGQKYFYSIFTYVSIKIGCRFRNSLFLATGQLRCLSL